ncbi:hypothetical protein BC6_00061 [Bacillus phage BC-6]|nr:hypothetical protein BC6_00061 [Bacillus phage BC-6]
MALTDEQQLQLDQARALYYTPVELTAPRKYYIEDPTSLKEVALHIIGFNQRQGEYDLLENYYRNITKINSRMASDASKPNNRIGHPFAKIIVKNATSYFTGEPIKVKPHKESRQKDLDRIDIENDTNEVNSELDRLSNLYGHAFEIHWRDTIDGKVTPRFKALSPKNCMIFHSMELDEKPIGAVVFTKKKDAVTKADHYSATVYTETTSQKFTFSPTKDSVENITEQPPIPHNVGFLPVIEYLNNEERESSFESVIPLIDSYNSVVSDTINESEYWADSFLVLTDMSGTDSTDIARMKRDRVLLVDGTGKAEFLNKQTNDKHIENIKDRLTSDIHKFSQIPNLHDEQFAANLSGTAIRMKIISLEEKTSEKETKFTKGLRRRYEIIFTALDKSSLEKTTDFVTFQYTRNLPLNLIEIADMVAKAPEGLWSKKTLRTLYPIEYNEKDEAEQIKKEAEESANAMATADPFKVDPKEHPLGSNQGESGMGKPKVAEPPKEEPKKPSPKE